MKSARSIFVVAATLALVPVVAFAQVPGEGVVTAIGDALTGPLARAMALIGIAFFGINCYRGNIPWGWGFAAILGIIATIGAPAIVDWVSSFV